jgi:catechol 2,3-dioxygenase-like lactoylglutathione lyase family enzyme
MNVNHLHLKVASADRARAFYERFFGLRVSALHGDIVFMRDEAGMDLALAPAASPEPLPEWFHFGFRLEDADAVERLYRTMADAGVPMKHPLERDDEDLTFFRCRDPDGYGIEVYWEPEPEAFG